MNSVFNQLKINSDEINDCLNKIENMKNINNFADSKTLQLISNISTKISYLREEVKELYLILLDNDDNIKTSSEINEINSYKINNRIQEILLPIMLLLKIKMENY
uniref:Uncharacterized protein n=1 Tax=Megaviridae environmental sample TaxID=1737588 RepID=A0A5J6VL81_9VIRU|nr:MAG: hypothetical protein [Megaviridae environmental sample]